MKIMLFKGHSPYHLKKMKKILKEKKDMIRSLNYTLYTGHKMIDSQIAEIKKCGGISEENIRKVLSKELERLSDSKKILEIECENLNKYIYDDMRRIMLRKRKKEDD